jgi:hypothetical protein
LNVNPLRYRIPLTLLGAAAGLALAACQPKAVEARSQVVEGLRFEYGVTDRGASVTRDPAHPAAQMHAGAPQRADHITLAVFDAKTNARVDDATVMLNIKGPGYPGHGSLPLQPATVNGDTIYGGSATLRHPGHYRLTFHAARPDRQYNPVKAVFAYERSK